MIHTLFAYAESLVVVFKNFEITSALRCKVTISSQDFRKTAYTTTTTKR